MSRNVGQPHRVGVSAEELVQHLASRQVHQHSALLGRHPGGDEVRDLPRGVEDDDAAVAGAGQHPCTVDDLVQDGVEIQGLADAQAGLAQAGQALPQSGDLPIAGVGCGQLLTSHFRRFDALPAARPVQPVAAAGSVGRVQKARDNTEHHRKCSLMRAIISRPYHAAIAIFKRSWGRESVHQHGSEQGISYEDGGLSSVSRQPWDEGWLKKSIGHRTYGKQGLVIGCLTGWLIAGVSLAATSEDDPETPSLYDWEPSTSFQIGAVALIGGATGAIEELIGVLIRAEQWKPITIVSKGGPQVGLRMRF